MKKFFVMGLGLSAVFAMTSCKSSESAYKKAYEKAKQQQAAFYSPARLCCGPQTGAKRRKQTPFLYSIIFEAALSNRIQSF